MSPLMLSVPITTGIAAMTVGPAKVLAEGPRRGDDPEPAPEPTEA